MRRRLIVTLALLGVAVSAWGAWIPAKAALAQVLLHKAWLQTLASGGAVHRPWPWADLHPVARLRVPAHGVDLIALEGAEGNALAWGPGHVAHSGAPGSRDTVVFGGHRDTHFRFLQHLRTGDLIVMQAGDGRVVRYLVEDAVVADSDRSELALEQGSRLLALVTCYPFDAPRAGGAQRYVVSAREVSL